MEGWDIGCKVDQILLGLLENIVAQKFIHDIAGEKENQEKDVLFITKCGGGTTLTKMGGSGPPFSDMTLI